MLGDSFATFEYTFHQIASFIEQLVRLAVRQSIRKDEIPVLLIRFEMLWRRFFGTLILTTQTKNAYDNRLIGFL